jgi:uncharacterized membrane protein YccC
MKATPPALPPTQQALDAVAELGSQWNKMPPTRNEAIQDAARLAAQLQKQVSELEKNPGLKKLEKTARDTAAQTAQDPAALQRKVEELQNKLGAVWKKPAPPPKNWPMLKAKRLKPPASNWPRP